MEISHERTFKNITGHTEPFVATFALDEWDFPQRSEIWECTLATDDKSKLPMENSKEYANRKDAIGKQTKSVNVKSDATIKSITKGREIHRNNGELHMQFSYPSVKPKVRVVLPPGYNHSCSFGIPEEKVLRSRISEEHTLDGTLFPGQHIRVRWWPE